MILPELEHLAVPVVDLVPNPRNTNRHPEKNLVAIADSLREFGQRQPIVVRKADSTVVAGDGRLEAAKRLGWETIAAVFVEDDELKAMRYAIADNRTSELSEWDQTELDKAIEVLRAEYGTADLPTFLPGFDIADLAAFEESAVRVGDIDVADEWVGMPDFELGTWEPYKSVKVHFLCQEDVDTFNEALAAAGGQHSVNEKTQWLYFPSAPEGDPVHTNGVHWGEEE
jgi:hypothetical protein